MTKSQLAKKNGDAPFSLTAIGNAHIDLAWLWPIRETKRKGARTFATALDNMRRYPEFKFGASQGQLYEWIKEDYPPLFEKIREKIAEDRWELMGAMWVESDTNIPSGESLIRQLLYGNAYWEKEFGRRSNYVWLPDTFGYSGALPQIIKKCGIDYFLTIKLFWNRYTEFPYSSFKWRGIDGTEIVAHMPPEGNYLSGAAPSSLINAAKGMAKKGQFGPALLPYGIGDGGGGPSPCHIEYLNREKNLRGLPPAKQGFISDFIWELRKTEGALPVYDGELFLECHLGTYTTQGRSKRYNRKSEQALHDAELLAALAMRVCGAVYPSKEIEKLWKEVLLYQFHDILPGSSINRVYDESHARYEVILQETAVLTETALKNLCNAISTEGMEKPAVIFNTLSFERSQWIKTDAGYSYVTVPSIGYTVIDLSCGENKFETENRMENENLSLEFDDTGAIVSIYSKSLEKELLSAPSNLLLIYDDTGDAWEVEYEYLTKPPERAELISQRFISDGPIRRVIQEYVYHKSSFTVEITLAEKAERPEFNISADWQEDGKMLRVRFEHNAVSDHVDCEIQFGHISRSSRNNVTSEKAQFEVCAHRWIECSQPGLGFALLSDCKYGFHAKGQVLEMNCLRSSNHPGHHMECGKHAFSYAVHADDGLDGHLSVIRAGYDFNYPLLITETEAKTGSLPQKHSFISSECPNIIIETVKKSETGDKLVMRSYEALGAPAKADFSFGFEAETPVLCDMTERVIGSGTEEIAYHGLEIQTVLI